MRAGTVDRVTFAGNSGSIQLDEQLTLDGDSPGDQFLVTGIGAFSITGSEGLNLTGTNFKPFVSVPNGSSLSVQTDITGPQGLVKRGAGALTLRGTATYQGNTEVRDGILALNNTTAGNGTLPAGTTLTIGDTVGAAASAQVRLDSANTAQIPAGVAITIAADGRLNLNGQTEGVGDVTLAGGRIDTAGGDLRALSITVTENSSITAFSAANGGGQISVFANSVIPINVAAGKDLTITAQIVGNAGITKDGPRHPDLRQRPAPCPEHVHRPDDGQRRRVAPEQ